MGRSNVRVGRRVCEKPQSGEFSLMRTALFPEQRHLQRSLATMLAHDVDEKVMPLVLCPDLILE